MTKISNQTPGPRGLHTDEGTVWLNGFETRDVKIGDKALQAALDTGWFIKGELDRSDARDQDAELAALRADLDASRKEADDLRAQLADAQKSQKK